MNFIVLAPADKEPAFIVMNLAPTIFIWWILVFLLRGAKNVMPLYSLQGTCNIVDFYHLLSWIVFFPGWKVPAYSDILVPNQLSILENTCCSPWIFLIIKKIGDTKSKREREKERSDKHSQPHMGLGMCFSLTMRTANCTATNLQEQTSLHASVPMCLPFRHSLHYLKTQL